MGPNNEYITDLIILPNRRILYILTQDYKIYSASFKPILDDYNHITLEINFTS